MTSSLSPSSSSYSSSSSSGLCCHNFDMERVLNLSLAVPSSLVSKDDQLCSGSQCNPCSESLLERLSNVTYQSWQEEVVELHEPNWWGVTTVNRNLTRLSCRATEEMWFDMMMSYGDLALHTNSHRPQEGWAKPSAPPDPIQYEFLPKIRPNFGSPGGHPPPLRGRHNVGLTRGHSE